MLFNDFTAEYYDALENEDGRLAFLALEEACDLREVDEIRIASGLQRRLYDHKRWDNEFLYSLTLQERKILFDCCCFFRLSIPDRGYREKVLFQCFPQARWLPLDDETIVNFMLTLGVNEEIEDLTEYLQHELERPDDDFESEQDE